jgi:hypothetical protein
MHHLPLMFMLFPIITDKTMADEGGETGSSNGEQQHQTDSANNIFMKRKVHKRLDNLHKNIAEGVGIIFHLYNALYIECWKCEQVFGGGVRGVEFCH